MMMQYLVFLIQGGLAWLIPDVPERVAIQVLGPRTTHHLPGTRHRADLLACPSACGGGGQEERMAFLAQTLIHQVPPTSHHSQTDRQAGRHD